MEVFISILRGINVSGHRKVEMAGLKALYEELGFEGVTTYIQSGNVIFKAAKKSRAHDLSKTIEQAVLKKYGFQIPLIIRKLSEMEKIVEGNPFLQQPGVDLEKFHITFLAEIPAQSHTEILKNLNYSPDKFILEGKEIFLYCPGGYGNTRLSNNFFENKLKVTATTRNWKTVNKLIELAKSIKTV